MYHVKSLSFKVMGMLMDFLFVFVVIYYAPIVVVQGTPVQPTPENFAASGDCNGAPAAGDTNEWAEEEKVADRLDDNLINKTKINGVEFLTRNSTVVTAQAGNKVLLPCHVKNVCDGTVSWIRRTTPEYHLLTVGLITYAGDDRYVTVHPFNSYEWSLQIRLVQLRDAGFYECQVTKHPPISIILELKVVEARATIFGPPEKFVKLGSSVELLCEIEESPEPPEFVFWYHNERMVNYDKNRGLNITFDLANKKSSLRILKATRDHSGNYSCVAGNAYPASAFVHILNDENPAAMQTGTSNRQKTNWSTVITHILILIVSSL